MSNGCSLNTAAVFVMMVLHTGHTNSLQLYSLLQLDSQNWRPANLLLSGPNLKSAPTTCSIMYDVDRKKLFVMLLLLILLKKTNNSPPLPK